MISFPVTIQSIRGTWNKKYGDHVIEIARFASELDTQVVGGFSKLLKYAKEWAREQTYQKILTYADCRFGSGDVYSECGFKYQGKTSPNYFYEQDGYREDRFSHRKVNDPEFLEEFGNTEREQNNNQGWFAIYDAGNEIYTLPI